MKTYFSIFKEYPKNHLSKRGSRAIFVNHPLLGSKMGFASEKEAVGANGEVVNAQFPSETAFIVRAVNSHSSLVATLQSVRKLFKDDSPTAEMIDEAIAKAEGK